MKQHRTLWFWCIWLILGYSGPARAASPRVEIIADSAQVKVESRTISVVKKGQTFRLLKSEGAWVAIQIDVDAGFVDRNVEDLDRPPLKSAGNAGEYESGIGAGLAALSALFNRRVTGEGELIDFSKQHWGMNLNRPFHPRYTVNGVIETRATQAYPWGGVYACADGDLLLLALQDRQWEALPNAMGNPELAKDERFTTPGKRNVNGRELRKIIAAWMRTQPRATVLAKLAEVGTPAGPVQTPPEVLAYPIYKTRNFLQPLPLPEAPNAVAPGLPFQLGPSKVGIAGPAPAPGEHNARVYAELGMTPQDIAAAAAEGII